MPKRRRVKEAQRHAAAEHKHPDLKGWEVEPVGVIVQTEQAWADRDNEEG